MGLNTHFKEAWSLNKKLKRLLQPSVLGYLIAVFVFAVAALVMQYYLLGAVELAAGVLLLVIYIITHEKRHKELQALGQTLFGNQDQIRGAENPLPMAMIRISDGEILWASDKFAQIADYTDNMLRQEITDYIPNFKSDWLTGGKSEYPYDVTIGNRRYRVYGTAARADDPSGTLLGMLYFGDLTELYQVRDEYVRSRPVVSIILVDNYEELTKNLTDSAVSLLNAKINDAITAWTDQYKGLLRKLERNRYLYIFEKRDLSHAIEEKFSLLEEAHQITNPAGVAASLSIGLGVDAETFGEGYNFAALGIEMALSRGGDQAVIKDRFNFSFYGGMAKEADHRSKVRSRVTANSLMELIGQSSQVFIMGHRNADLDSVGAAMGISCLCRKRGRKGYIVLDVQNNSADKLIEEIRQVPEYKDVFISGQDALLMCDNRSILVVVDTNRPDQVESKPLLEAISKICVVDHHRRAAEYINPVVVNFHEPYASSAAELATELLQYTVEKDDVLPIEAKSLLAGIFLDTKNFNVRTGERTFEAAAFLRRLGADPVEVKKLLQSDFQDTVAKYQIIKSARLYKQELAIAALNTGTTRVLAARAADELLNVSGISASFVLYPDGDQVIISARSIGNVNVQMILEPLGGGGNAATAGAQVHDTTVKDALDSLVASIDRYFEN